MSNVDVGQTALSLMTLCFYAMIGLKCGNLQRRVDQLEQLLGKADADPAPRHRHGTRTMHS